MAAYVHAIPQHEVNRRSELKRLARRATRDLVPPHTQARLGKTEPDTLFDRGFREAGLPTARDLLTDPISAQMGFVDPGSLRSSYDSFLRGDPVRYDFWWPLTLEMWLRAHWT